MKKLTCTLLSLSLSMLAQSSARAAEDSEDSSTADEVLKLVRPHHVVRLGVGHLDGNARRLGQFTGTDEPGLVPLLDVELVSRDENTGTWLRIDANNLASEQREVHFENERQGVWKYFLDYSRTPYDNPLLFHTGLLGSGGAVQQVTALAPRQLELNTVRENWALGLQSQLAGAFETQVRFRNEKKRGQRPLGTEGGAFVTEPIDAVTKEVEATLGYSDQKLQLQAGYLGSWYHNRNTTLIAHGTDVDDISPAQISLPPDNAAHQFSLSGGYSLAAKTRATFKLSHERATQDESFRAPLGGVSRVTGQDLGGEVHTTLVHAGLTTQAGERLGLLANFRYEDRDDQTPIGQYLTPSASFPHSLNVRHSHRLAVGKLEANYRLSYEHSLALGIDHDQRQREVPPSMPFTTPAAPAQARQVSYRSETEETAYRLEFRRGLTEAINGSLAHVFSRRQGSVLLPADNNASPDFVAPLQWADRERAKWRLALDWVPAEPVSVQLVFEDSTDRYSGRALGPRRGTGRLYSLDLSYALSNDWQLTGWASRGKTSAEQASCGSINRTSPAPFCTLAANWLQWSAKLDDRTQALGLGLRGSPTRKLKLGADLNHAEEQNNFGFGVLAANAASLPAGLPPSIVYRTTNLAAFVDYAMKSDDGWRLDYVYQNVRTNDWSWDLAAGGASIYSDGTTVEASKKARAQFFGVSYYHRWR